MSAFYEDDEPDEKIAAAFEQGDKGYTGKGISVADVDLSTIRIENNTAGE